MRAIAILGKNRNRLGQAILARKGLLAWASVCGELTLNESMPAPLHWTKTKRDTDISDDMKNVMVMMVLNFIRGTEDVCGI